MEHTGLCNRDHTHLQVDVVLFLRGSQSLGTADIGDTDYRDQLNKARSTSEEYREQNETFYNQQDLTPAFQINSPIMGAEGAFCHRRLTRVCNQKREKLPLCWPFERMQV